MSRQSYHIRINKTNSIFCHLVPKAATPLAVQELAVNLLLKMGDTGVNEIRFSSSNLLRKTS